MRPGKALFLALTIFLFPACAAAGSNAVVIKIVPAHGGVVYEFNGTHSGLESLVDALRSEVTTVDINSAAIVLAQEDVTIFDVTNLRGALQKFGFGRIRYFYYGSEEGRMAEFAFIAPAIRYTEDPRR